MNVFDSHPGKGRGKGDAFPLDEARVRARYLASRYPGWVAIFAGWRVASAFDAEHDSVLHVLTGPPPFAFSAVLPHPSGVNRWWNDPRNVAEAKKFIEEIRA